jgi:hypothetical protein
MALTQCTKCLGKVSTLAAACPHCGNAVERSIPTSDTSESSLKPSRESSDFKWEGSKIQKIAQVAGKTVIILIVVFGVIGKFQRYYERRARAVDSGIEVGIETHQFGHDSVWLKNGSEYRMTEVSVSVEIVQRDKTVAKKTLSQTSEIGAGQRATWKGELWISGSWIGEGSTIVVKCSQLAMERPFTYRNTPDGWRFERTELGNLRDILAGK